MSIYILGIKMWTPAWSIVMESKDTHVNTLVCKPMPN